VCVVKPHGVSDKPLGEEVFQCYGRSNLHRMGQLTHTRRSDGVPEPDGGLKTVTRVTIIHYRQVYLNRFDPIVFMTVTVDTSDRVYDFSLHLFLLVHREESLWLMKYQNIRLMKYQRNGVNFVSFVSIT
jgi:hypothetical protein